MRVVYIGLYLVEILLLFMLNLFTDRCSCKFRCIFYLFLLVAFIALCLSFRLSSNWRITSQASSNSFQNFKLKSEIEMSVDEITSLNDTKLIALKTSFEGNIRDGTSSHEQQPKVMTREYSSKVILGKHFLLLISYMYYNSII